MILLNCVNFEKKNESDLFRFVRNIKSKAFIAHHPGGGLFYTLLHQRGHLAADRGDRQAEKRNRRHSAFTEYLRFLYGIVMMWFQMGSGGEEITFPLPQESKSE